MPNLDISTKRNTCAKIMAVALLTLAVGITTSMAQTNVYTDPVGFITLTAVGTNGLSGNALSFLGLGMTQIVTNRGLLTAASGTQLTVNNPLTAGQFNSGSLGPLYFIEITSGTAAGLIDDLVSNNTTAVFTGSNDSGLLAGTESYKIYPHWTIASIFGPASSTALQGGASTPPADAILVPSQGSQGFSTYFLFTGKGGPAWRLSGGGNVDQAQARIFIDQGVLINRFAGTTTNMQLVGAVKLGPTLIPIGGTNNFIGNVYASSAMTLNSSGLATQGIAGGASVPPADGVLIHNDSTGVYSTYFYFTGKGGPKWELSGGGSADQGATQIPLGASVLIQRVSATGFNWTPVAPYVP